jgi:1,4-alpha-glucan branching enzyme
MIEVRFVYLTGVPRRVLTNARLVGEWDGWSTEVRMAEVTADDGCPGFVATVSFDDAEAGRSFGWGVRAAPARTPAAVPAWAIPTEVPDGESLARHRTVRLPGPGESREERYHLTWARHLGAQKVLVDGDPEPQACFRAWAPHARAVEVLVAPPGGGWIDDDGSGADPARSPVPLTRGDGGVWDSGPVGRFADWRGTAYALRIVNAQGQAVVRTDMWSRWQAGRGATDPRRGDWDGDLRTLDGTLSCSVVVDQDVVRPGLEPGGPPADRPGEPDGSVPDEAFWADEFDPARPVPTRVEDLVIYELHVGALGHPRTDSGTLADAVALLDHLVALGVNAVELMPLSEYSGNLSWGYGNTLHLVVESSAGGRDEYKHFVRACHRRGIAVLQDVVYNHFDGNAERSVWQYDSTAPEENAWYWYEGRPADHPTPDGGYLDNGSSGWTPRFHEEAVRRLFVTSAAEFVEEFHVDGLRVDLTQAIHRDNALHADGRPVRSANLFGQKLLREWSRTLRLLRPAVMLVAEDHTGWDAVTQGPDVGGLGFDATWFADFYHHLVGDADGSAGNARLLREAGFGHGGPLAMGRFAGVLAATGGKRVVYHESHDEAGNARGSRRTVVAAVDGAALTGETRRYAEARARVVAGLALLSAGTPMFFMGEEVAATREYRYDNVASSKEDLLGDAAGVGAAMFRWYRDAIALRRGNPALRSRHLDVLHAHDADRVVAFTRRLGTFDVLVVASLNDTAFRDGYRLDAGPSRLPPGAWREVLNSDSAFYGGADVGNLGAALPSEGGRLDLRLPANGLLVLVREA